MSDWPAIEEPELRRRMALPDAEFRNWLLEIGRSLGPRAFDEEQFQHALGYPWPRPATSYLLDDGAITDVSAGEAADVVTREASGRFPLLAFGSNGAPERLTLKLAHLPPEQRRLLVIAGDLHDFDVGVSAMPTTYGSMAATIVPSPGTVVRASILWATAEQVTTLTWTEFSYALGRLDPVRFEPDGDAMATVPGVLAYASRWGALRIAGEVVAQGGIVARDRTLPALSQEQLLDSVARELLGSQAGARELYAALMSDFPAAALALVPALIEPAAPLVCPAWTLHPVHDG